MVVVVVIIFIVRYPMYNHTSSADNHFVYMQKCSTSSVQENEPN